MLKLPGASTCFTSCSQSQGERRGDIAESRVLDLDSWEEVSNTQSSRTERKESSSLRWEKTRHGSNVLVLESRWTRVKLASDMSSLQLIESKGSKKCCFKSLTSLASGSSRRPAWWRPCTSSHPAPSFSNWTLKQVSVEPFLEPSLVVNFTASFHFPTMIFDNFCCCLTWPQVEWEGYCLRSGLTISILSAGRILMESSWAKPNEGLVTRAREEERQRLPAVHL